MGGVVAATLAVYTRIKEELLPVPSKSHYTFNLRDFAKVVQGIMRGDPRATTDVSAVSSRERARRRSSMFAG